MPTKLDVIDGDELINNFHLLFLLTTHAPGCSLYICVNHIGVDDEL
jgi:hypothetical protein